MGSYYVGDRSPISCILTSKNCMAGVSQTSSFRAGYARFAGGRRRPRPNHMNLSMTNRRSCSTTLHPLSVSSADGTTRNALRIARFDCRVVKLGSCSAQVILSEGRGGTYRCQRWILHADHWTEMPGDDRAPEKCKRHATRETCWRRRARRAVNP